MNHGLDGLFYEQVQTDFARIADYVWKAPRLIQHETALELDKLDDYFPVEFHFRDRRWKEESRKLEGTFPYMIAVGNLLSTASLYESYLLMIARKLDARFALLAGTSGQGQDRIHRFFKAIGLDHSALATYAPVEAAISIRNCLAHCSGVLDWYRHAEKLRDMVQRGRFLSVSDIARRRDQKSEMHEVWLEHSALGERLAISNDYSFVACCYFQQHLLRLIEEAIPMLKDR